MGFPFLSGWLWGWPLWATVSLAVSVWIPDLLVSISLPTFLYFVWNSQATSRMLGVQLPYAAELYNDALTWAMVKRSVLVNLAFLVVVWIAYAIGLHRRLHNA